MILKLPFPFPGAAGPKCCRSDFVNRPPRCCCYSPEYRTRKASKLRQTRVLFGITGSGSRVSHVCSCVCCCSRRHGFSSACMCVTRSIGFTISPVWVLERRGVAFKYWGYAATELPRALLPLCSCDARLSLCHHVCCCSVLRPPACILHRLRRIERPATGPTNCATWK